MFYFFGLIVLDGDKMYICNCAGVREAEIEGAIAIGARTVSEVFEVVGKEQSCGQCTVNVSEMLHSIPADRAPAI